MLGCLKHFTQIFARPDQSQYKTLKDQWDLHQSKWRWLSIGIFGLLGPPCHVLYNISIPLCFIVGIYVALGIVEARVPDAIDPTNVFRSTFTMTSFVISLLMAWKVTRAYERWWAARSSFAGVGNGVTSIMRLAATYIDDPNLLAQYQRWLLAWHFSVLQLVTGKTQITDPRVKEILEPDELKQYEGTNKPRLLAGAAVGVLVEMSNLNPQQKQTMEVQIQYTTKEYGVPVRIKLQAPIYAITSFTTHVLFLWLLVLPLGLGGFSTSATSASETGRLPRSLWWEVAAALLLSVILLGLDEVCNQLEDPFWAMPLESIVQTTVRDVPRITKEVQAIKALVAAKQSLGCTRNNADGGSSSKFGHEAAA